MQERLKKIREYFDMTQLEFAKKLGIGQSTLAMMEVSKRDISDRHIKTICAICNINERWLRTGEGEMISDSETFSLDEYAKQRQVSDLELDIIKLYFELDSDTRRGLLKHFKDGLLKDKPTAETEKEHDKNTPSNEPTLEELEEEYKKRHYKSVSKTESSVSSGIEENISKVI